MSSGDDGEDLMSPNGSDTDGLHPLEKTPADVGDAIEAALEKLPSLENLPEPKKHEIIRTVSQEVFAVFERTGPPKMDAETMRLVAATAEKENQNKFDYLTRKQQIEADAAKRDHELDVECHRDSVALARPMIYAIIMLVLGVAMAAVWLILNGKEATGEKMLIGLAALFFGYLGGLGTPRDIFDSRPTRRS